MYCEIEENGMIPHGTVTYSEPFLPDFIDYQHVGTNYTVVCQSGYEPQDPNATVSTCVRFGEDDPYWDVETTTCRSKAVQLNR